MGDQARLVVVPGDGDDRGTVVLDARVDADPDRHQAIGEHRLGSGVDASIPRRKSMKLELAADKPVLDQPQIGVRAQTAAHLGEPAFGLPGRDRRVAPKEQHAVASAQVGSNLGLLHAAAIQLFEQLLRP